MNKFDSDYMVGAHPDVLQALVDTNYLRTPGYGGDEYTKKASSTILKTCKLNDDSGVYFLIGGTLTNRVLLDIILEGYQGVLASDMSHIFTHESGAIEALGHKILPLKSTNGKITASQIDTYMSIYTKSQNRIHTAEPGAVYLTQPTELGTLYTKSELSDISKVCKKFDIPLYVDGARLAYALSAPHNDISISDLAKFADCFYIGGAKCGALMGEAGVIKPTIRKRSFLTNIKRHGALFAKGRIVAVQFEALFENHLYLRIGKRADELSKHIYDTLLALGCKFFVPTETNQSFVLFTQDELDDFKKNGFDLGVWDTIDGKGITRIITDWTFSDEDIDEFLQVAKKIKQKR